MSRIIQKRKDNNGTCYNRIRNLNSSCFTYDTTKDFSNVYFNNSYQYDIYTSRPILGVDRYYNNSGYILDISIKNPNNLNYSTNQMDIINYIDNKTSSLMSITNFYNVNYNLFIIRNILYEEINGFFKPKVLYHIFDNNPEVSGPYIAAILFSFVSIYLQILYLRKTEIIQTEINIRKFNLSLSVRFKNFFISCKHYFLKYYRKPDNLELISKLKI